MAEQLMVLSVQVGTPQTITIEKKSGDFETVQSAIWKKPVSTAQNPQAIAVKALGLVGDTQVTPAPVHGGVDKAVYAYPLEHYHYWGDNLEHGMLGENLTVQGLDETQIWIGDRIVFPDCVLRVTEHRVPCSKFNAHMKDNQSVKKMVKTGFSGWLMAVEQEGTISAGQVGVVQAGPREKTVREFFIDYYKK